MMGTYKGDLETFCDMFIKGLGKNNIQLDLSQLLKVYIRKTYDFFF